VFEIVTPRRSYRLFSDNYDVKEQWIYALDQYLIHQWYTKSLLRSTNPISKMAAIDNQV